MVRGPGEIQTPPVDFPWFPAPPNVRQEITMPSTAEESRAYRAADPARKSAENHDYRLRHPKRTAFHRAKAHAKRRGIEWLMTQKEFIDFWGEKFNLRGTAPEDLHMCRLGDLGPYQIGNVVIATCADNLAKRV